MRCENILKNHLLVFCMLIVVLQPARVHKATGLLSNPFVLICSNQLGPPSRSGPQPDENSDIYGKSREMSRRNLFMAFRLCKNSSRILAEFWVLVGNYNNHLFSFFLSNHGRGTEPASTYFHSSDIRGSQANLAYAK